VNGLSVKVVDLNLQVLEQNQGRRRSQFQVQGRGRSQGQIYKFQDMMKNLIVPKKENRNVWIHPIVNGSSVKGVRGHFPSLNTWSVPKNTNHEKVRELQDLNRAQDRQNLKVPNPVQDRIKVPNPVQEL
jgi:hypothetical protein